mgnify:CR=1 FL=1
MLYPEFTVETSRMPMMIMAAVLGTSTVISMTVSSFSSFVSFKEKASRSHNSVEAEKTARKGDAKMWRELDPGIGDEAKGIMVDTSSNKNVDWLVFLKRVYAPMAALIVRGKENHGS